MWLLWANGVGALGMWVTRKSYPYIQCNPLFIHSSDKAWFWPRLLRHTAGSGAVLGGLGGGAKRVGGTRREALRAQAAAKGLTYQ